MAAASPQLRKALVRIYRDPNSVQRLLDDARVPHAVGGGRIENEWNEAVRQAKLQGLLLELVQLAVDEYPRDPGLVEGPPNLVSRRLRPPLVARCRSRTFGVT
jgi:hypothetical protein